MAIKSHKATTPSRRHRSDLVMDDITKGYPEKSLVRVLPKKSGRNNTGKITVRHQGGRNKRFLRVIDFKRDKRDIEAKVSAVEYDPNRTASIALLIYKDGEKRYILAPVGIKVGEFVLSSDVTDTKPGNAMPLKNIPVGTTIHNIELLPGRGAKIVRSAGVGATIMSKDVGKVVVKMPSTEIRVFNDACYATIGQIGNVDHSNTTLGKAGRSRHRGIRPTVRGVAMDPGSHPHGGGEGRSGIGMKTPKSVYGKPSLGVRTRSKKKHSNKYIMTRRKKR
ncbi:MAG: 50S ribosomal protein L2 [bacterium]|nr:50S ribosomal protein L2 [bacterium]